MGSHMIESRGYRCEQCLETACKRTCGVTRSLRVVGGTPTLPLRVRPLSDIGGAIFWGMDCREVDDCKRGAPGSRANFSREGASPCVDDDNDEFVVMLDAVLSVGVRDGRGRSPGRTGRPWPLRDVLR